MAVPDHIRKVPRPVNTVYHEIEGGEHMFRGQHNRAAQAFIREFFTPTRPE